MRLFHSRHLIRATIAVILGVAIASCKGGPVSPSEPAIQLSHTTLVFTHSTQQQVTITNLETETIDWRVLSSTASWLSGAPGSGTIGPRGSGTLTVQIDRQAVPQGSHSASLQVGSGGSSIALNVSVVTQAAAQAGLQPQALSFAPSESSRSIEVVNSGGSTLDWTLSGPEWATFSPSSGSLAPGGRRQVTVTALRTGLSGGLYQGTLRLNSNGGSPTADLTLDVAGVSGLRVDPATLDFGTAGSEATLRVINDTDRSLSWTAQPGGPWISLSSTSGQLPPRLSQVLTVQVSRGGLSHGTNQAPILFSTSGGATSASVKATIEPANNPNPSSSGQAKIDVTPTSLDFGAGTTELSLQIFNDGDQPLEWSAVPQASWIKLPLGSGRVSPHSSAVVTVQVTRAGLTAGTYQSTVRFTSSVGTVTAAIAATVSPVTTPPPSTPPAGPPPTNPPKISATPTGLNFGTSVTEMTFKVQNLGGSTLTWSGGASNAWISLPTNSGSVSAGASQIVTVRVSRANLGAAGTYTGTIQLSSNGGSASVAVTLEVQAPSSPPPSGGSGTVNVRDFGAKGDGVTNDASAFDAAIKALPASGGTVVIPTGIYLLDAITNGPYRQINLRKASNVTLVGEGMDHTILKVAPRNYASAVSMILIEYASDITIKNLALDGNPAFVTYNDEQSHQIEIVSSSNVRIEGVRFSGSGGDAIRLLGLGEAGEPWTDTVWIENCHITYTRRNGISLQRGVRYLEIRDNLFERISQQAISSEPSGSNASQEILIEGNVIRHISAAYSLALAGIRPADPLRSVTVRNNILNDAAAYILWTDGLVFVGNTINGDRFHSPLKLHDVSEARIENNTITGPKQDGTGLIQLINEDNVLPFDVTIRNNTLMVPAGLSGIHVRDALRDVTITGNKIIGSGSIFGIIFQTTVSAGITRRNFTVSENEIQNFANGITFVRKTDPFSRVTIMNNTLDHDQNPSAETTGIFFDKTGAFEQFAQVASNVFGSGILTDILVR